MTAVQHSMLLPSNAQEPAGKTSPVMSERDSLQLEEGRRDAAAKPVGEDTLGARDAVVVFEEPAGALVSEAALSAEVARVSPARLLRVCNFRDVGGVFEEASGVVRVRKCCLFRSGSPRALCDEEVCTIERLGVCTLVDLRSNQEKRWRPLDPALMRQYKPCADAACKYFSVPYVGDGFVRGILRKSTPWAVMRSLGWFLVWDQKKGTEALLDSFQLHDLYEVFLETCKKEILQVLTLLTDPRNYPAWIFCSIGKDRTGLTVALVLACLGVSKENICREYALSTDKPPEEVTHGGAVVPGANLLDAPPAVMYATLCFIEARYGSISGYLENIGFTSERQAKLRELLLERQEEEDLEDALEKAFVKGEMDEAIEERVKQAVAAAHGEAGSESPSVREA